ncbi:MAG: PTS sugar transporter subunit IIA [Burkholderiaceae bacterium]|jgi:PTS system ascorbate-specific IIA component|nr:PTS sugar transporter subunit IIA [Burkholderiaceae bacterium]
MIGILVVSHEPFGSALIRCTRHVFGRLPPQLAALDVVPDENPEMALSAGRELLARINDGSGAVVFTDVYGATPSRIAAQLAVPDRVRVVAGANLPMLLKALQNRRMPVDELVEALLDSGHRSIRAVDADDRAAGAPSTPAP